MTTAKEVLTKYLRIQETLDKLKNKIDELDSQATQDFSEFFTQLVEKEEPPENPNTLKQAFMSGEKEKIFFTSRLPLND